MLTEQLGQELTAYKLLLGELDQRVQADVKELRALVGGTGSTPRLTVPEAPLIAFVHIPKTAGATVTSMFAAAYSRGAVHKAGNYMKNAKHAEEKVSKAPGGWTNWHRRGGRLSVGHVPYGAFQRHLPESTRYMTFLREPVDRVLSHYYRHIHIQDPSRSGQPKSRAGARIKAASIEEAMVEMRMPQLNNLSTRFLSGHEPTAELPESALEDAQANLHAFAFVGIQERFEESLVLLRRMLDLPAVPYVDRHVSRAGSRPSVDEISDEQRDLITDCNRLDAELYRFGLAQFEEAVARAGDGLEAEVEKLRAEDRAAREEEWRRTVDADDPRSQ